MEKANPIIIMARHIEVTGALTGGEGYSRRTYMMIDENITAVYPATTYIVLRVAG